MWGGRRAELGAKPEQGLEKELWRAMGAGWGGRRAGEVGKKGGVSASFIQCSSPAIDNLSTDIS